MIVNPLLVIGPLASARRELPELATRLHDLPSLAVLGLALLGLVVLLIGARARRPLAAVGGAALGCLAVAVAPSWAATNVGVSSTTLMAAVAGLLALGGAFFPALFILVAGALPGAWVGALFPVRDDPQLGMAIGAVLTGIAALFVARWVAAAAAAILGAGLITGALLAVGGSWPALRFLSERPLTALALTAVLAVAGAAFQLRGSWPRPGIKDRGDSELASDQISTVIDR